MRHFYETGENSVIYQVNAQQDHHYAGDDPPVKDIYPSVGNPGKQKDENDDGGDNRLYDAYRQML